MTMSKVEMPSEERVYTDTRELLWQESLLWWKLPTVGVDDEMNVQLICLFL